MKLFDLPVEIVAYIITRYLDIKSIETLYNTGNMNLRELIVAYVRKIKISRSNLANLDYLQSNFYKDISEHIKELDMTMIPSFNRLNFMTMTTTLKKMKFLNISFTNITLDNIALVMPLMPSMSWPELKNIYVNFGNFNGTKYMNSSAVLTHTQNFVQNLENIHLLTTLNDLLYPKSLFTILRKAKLNSLSLTVLPFNIDVVNEEHQLLSQVPIFKQLHIRILDWRRNIDICFPSLKKFPILAMLDLKEYEFIIIFCSNLTTHTVFVSRLFVNFFNNNFDLNVQCISKLRDAFNEDTAISGNVAVMLWKKNAFNFDDIFFRKLLREIKEYFPYCPKSNEINVSNRYDWFVLRPSITENKVTSKSDYERSFVLDYDTLFEKEQQIQISYELRHLAKIPVSLNSNSFYLKKITYLSLSGLARYDTDFFNILFKCCTILITLNVEANKNVDCWVNLRDSLPLSSTLKNFRLVNGNADVVSLCMVLMQCRAIENVFCLGVSDTAPEVPARLFEKCPNLYNLLIEIKTPFGNTSIRHRPAFTRYRFGGFVTDDPLPRSIFMTPNISYTYDPYVDVFKLNPIRDSVYFGTRSY